MIDGTPSPVPLAADPSAGTDAAAPGTGAVIAGATVPSDRGGKPLWARLDSPFGAGFLLTLGGLAAVVLGIAIANIATVIIYIALAMFAALGLDPVLKWFERHNVKRAWAIVIVALTFTVIGVGLLLLVVPTLVDADRRVHHRYPRDDRELRDDRHLRLARGHLRSGPDHPRRRYAVVHHEPREHRGHLGRAAQDRRRYRRRHLGRTHRHRADALLRGIPPRHQGVADAVRVGAQPREGAEHDRSDHRFDRQLPHGNGHPGVLQLHRGVPAALLPAAARTRC